MKKSLKISLIAIFALLFTTNSYSQVVIVNLSQPPPNQWHVEDMWNLTLTNTSSESIKVYLYGTVESHTDGLIFEGTSAVFGLPANYSGRIDRRQLEPGDGSFVNSEVEEIILKTGTMPAGTYTICITVMDANTDLELGRGCVIQPIANISPPELLIPVDEAALNEPLPIFSWLPPMPLTGNYFVSYKIKIVELLDGQVPLEAMESNPAWYIEKGIMSTSFQFPISARPLEPGKSYAWQLRAFNDNQNYEIGESEVWSFNYINNYQMRIDSLIIVRYEWDLDNDRSYFKIIKEEEDTIKRNLYQLDPDNDGKLKIRTEQSIYRDYPCVLCGYYNCSHFPDTLSIVTDKWDLDKDVTMNKDTSQINPELDYNWNLNNEGNTSKIIKEEEDAVKRNPYRWDLDGDGKIEIRTEVCDDGNDRDEDENVAYIWDFDNDGKVKIGCAGKVTINHRGYEWDLDNGGSYFETIQEEEDTVKRSPYEWDLDTGYPFTIFTDEICDDGIQTEGDGCDRTYRFELYVTNVNQGDANLSITGITKTTPKSKLMPIVEPDEKEPLLIKSGEQGVITGTIKADTITLKKIWIEIKLEDKFNPKEDFILLEECSLIAIQPIPLPDFREYDFGDAPDEIAPDPDFPSLKASDGARHVWTNIFGNLIPSQFRAWLGVATEVYNGGNPDCEYSYGLNTIWETDSKQIDNDTYDNGIHFFNSYCTWCVIDSLDVTISVDPDYIDSIPLLFNAWFDYTRDGDWDDEGGCCPPGSPLRNEHIEWLYAKPLCPTVGSKIAINSTTFEIDPSDWPNSNSARYRLYFKSGFNTPVPDFVFPEMWARFRLTPAITAININNASKPTGLVLGGEVEDYMMICWPDSYDFGDAPDELDASGLTHYCTHLLNPAYSCLPFNNDRISPSQWVNLEAAYHQDAHQEWLGDISVGCNQSSGVFANEECNGKTIDQDNFDDGVDFSLFHFPFYACDTQTVDVMINVANASIYNEGSDLHLHAWFDWGQDGNWDTTYQCNFETGDDHVYWLTAQPICPNPGQIYNIGSYDFNFNPTLETIWPDSLDKQQIFRLTFLSGQPAFGEEVIDTLWSRFRLSYDQEAETYWGGVSRGEVEDYPILPDTNDIPCDSADYGDAPDGLNNSSLHYCTHENNPDFPPAKHYDIKKCWLGDINIENPCECGGLSADRECYGKTIDQDNFDDGVSFANFNCDYDVCDIQTVDVLINTAGYGIGYPMHLHAWIDWNQNGYWTDTYQECDLGPGDDHIFWLTALPLCPDGEGEMIEINDYDFVIDDQEPLYWNQGRDCQMFRLTFLSGEPPEGGAQPASEFLWSRFRLSLEGYVADKYYEKVEYGEVEDYKIICDSSQSACGPTFIDQRDGKIYNAVQIGTQCWMAENLAYLPAVSPSSSGSNTSPYYYVYDYQGTDVSVAKTTTNYQTYGVLYNWAAVMAGSSSSNSVPSGVQGICPTGWHLPSDEEWKILEGEVDSQYGYPDLVWDQIGWRGTDAGGNLKETGTTHWISTNNGATNSSGFTALGGGHRNQLGIFSNMGLIENFFSSSEYSTLDPIGRTVTRFYTSVGYSTTYRDWGIAVRCLKD